MAAKSRKPSRTYRRQGRTYDVRDERESFLIVCEGEKTEPNYFRSFDVLNAVVNVVGAGCDPFRVVDEACGSRMKLLRPRNPTITCGVCLTATRFRLNASIMPSNVLQATILK